MLKEKTRKESIILPCVLPSGTLTTQIPTSVFRFASSGLDKAPDDSALPGAPKPMKY